MAVNVPLVHISDLTEQTTAADTDLMVIGGTDAKKIKWSTIISLIKTKLNIGSSAISGIGDGTITGAISSLNSASTFAQGLKFKRYTYEGAISAGVPIVLSNDRYDLKLVHSIAILTRNTSESYDSGYCYLNSNGEPAYVPGTSSPKTYITVGILYNIIET